MKRLKIKINAIIINNKPNILDKINDLAVLISNIIIVFNTIRFICFEENYE